MAYVDPTCRAIAAKAANGKISEADIMAAFDRIEQRRLQLEAQGQATGKSARMKLWAQNEAEKTKIAAAMTRRHAALNVLVRDRLDQQITGMINAGLKPHQAIRAVL